MDFFDYPLENQFDTIIGNPPYVKHKDIAPSTKENSITAFLMKGVIYTCFS